MSSGIRHAFRPAAASAAAGLACLDLGRRRRRALARCEQAPAAVLPGLRLCDGERWGTCTPLVTGSASLFAETCASSSRALAPAEPTSPTRRPSSRGRRVARKSGEIFASTYELKASIGAGGTGEVFRARHRRTGALRAVKRMKLAKCFGDEVRALASLEHPNIVGLVETFEEERTLYIVEELCTGPCLLDFLLQSPLKRDGTPYLPERSASIILNQSLKALLCCHDNGFAHRDVKPENLVLSGDGLVKLIDFGLASPSSGTDMRGAAGTPHYMAPEMLGKDAYSGAVDVWSLGVVFFELLSGEPLIRVEREDQAWRCLEQDPAYVRRRLADSRGLADNWVSASARELLGLMLERDPGKRISARDALKHPFVRQFAAELLDGSFSVE